MTHRRETHVVCRVCGGLIWWAGSTGLYRWLHLNLIRADHAALPKRR